MVKNLSISRYKSVAVLAGALLFMAFAGEALAVDAFDATKDKWIVQINAGISLGKVIFALLGFFLFGTGLFYFYKDNKQPGQGHLKTGFVSLLVGSALLIITWFIGMFTESFAEEGAEAMSYLDED